MNIIDLKPKDGEVLVMPFRKKQGLIEIIREEWEFQNVGMVVAIGHCSKIPEVKKGDEVVFPEYAGKEIVVNGRMYLVMTLDSILGVVEKSLAV